MVCHYIFLFPRDHRYKLQVVWVNVSDTLSEEDDIFKANSKELKSTPIHF